MNISLYLRFKVGDNYSKYKFSKLFKNEPFDKTYQKVLG